jgi:uncharacterized protein (DUF427 family)/predicted amidophosphoribosyltransferase
VPAEPLSVVTGTLQVVALGPYEGALRAAILAIKRGERAPVAALAALMAPHLDRGAILIPVPTTRARAARRGFDQAVLLAHALQRRVPSVRVAHVLEHRGASQAGLGRRDRLAARARFGLSRRAERVRRAAQLEPGRSVTLIDDVCTTGATLEDAAGVLREAGLVVSSAAVAAFTVPGRAGGDRATFPIATRSIFANAIARERSDMKAIWNGTVLAESDKTKVVEGNHYFPPDSIATAHFQPSDTHTVCPWKGTASYYSLDVDGKRNKDAAWYYPTPKNAAAEIAGYVAFWKGVEVKP